MTTLLWMFASAFATALYFVFTRRRHTPQVKLELDAMPEIGDALGMLAGVTGAVVQCDNQARVFQNGALFDALEADIRAARHSVHLETFVWTTGTMERRIVSLLADRARAGLHIRLIVDAVGGMKADLAAFEALRAAGAEVLRYCRPRWWNWRRFNHRTHRKLAIVDGRIGYTFGHGIADTWLGDAEDAQHWRDTGVRLEGPVVHSLQAVFMENWIEESHCLPAGDAFPSLAPCGTVAAHVVHSAAGDAVSAVALLYTVAIACAREEIIIQNPYFAPDAGVAKLLVEMVRRGVAVHLMVPGEHTDSPFVRRAGRHLYAALLDGGVRLYEFQPTLCHQKIVIVDGRWSHVGSTNFDARSLALNEEVGIGLLDRDIAQQLRAAFHADLARSAEIDPRRWHRRSWLQRAGDWIAYRLHDQL